MKNIKTALVASVAAASFIAADVHAATEWNVSLWGKRRAFTENVEKLAELVEAKTDGEFTLNISYGGKTLMAFHLALSKWRSSAPFTTPTRIRPSQ